MSRYRYLITLLFKPRNSTERVAQVLIWIFVLMSGGGAVWNTWTRHVVRGEAFTWEGDGRHWAGLAGVVLLIAGCDIIASSGKKRARLGQVLLYGGLIVQTLASDDPWVGLIWLASVLIVVNVVFHFWPGAAAKRKQPDPPPSSDTGA